MIRPYQQNALNKIRQTRDTVRKGVVVWPTGSGKTVLFSHLPSTLGMRDGEQMLVLVHRDELVYQSAEKLRKYNPDLHIAVEKAQYRADENLADVIVASVQTIGRNKLCKETGEYEFCDRISRFDRNAVKYIVVDEAHHCTGDSYKSILAYFNCLKGTSYDSNDKYLLGVTATPKRSDNIGLESIFDDIIDSKPIVEMIDDGWLSKIKAYAIPTTVDISKVGVSAGDFKIGELERTVNTPSRNRLIVDKYIAHGGNLPGLAFTVDIQHSIDLASAFSDAGIPAFALSSRTSESDRHLAIEMFKSGNLRILVSCGVLSEGFDAPNATVGLMCRPTKSGLLYQQQVGRVLRPSPSPEELAAMREAGSDPGWIKQTAIVLDFVDNSGRHNLHTAPTLVGLSPKLNLNGKSLTDTAKEIEQTISKNRLPISMSDVEDMSAFEAIAKSVDLLSQPRVSVAVASISRYKWTEVNTDSFALCLPDYVIVRVEQNTLGQWEVSRSVRGVRTVVDRHADMKAAIKSADTLVPPECGVLLDGEAGWRKKPISDKQVEFLWRLDREAQRTFKYMNKYKAMLTGYGNKHKAMTMGWASDKINSLKAGR